MLQVVFTSTFQDEVSLVDPGVAGLQFTSGLPQTVTDEQAEILLSNNPAFKKFESPNRYVPPQAPEPAPVIAPEKVAAE